MTVRTIEELLPEDLEKIEVDIRNHKVELFKFIVHQFKTMKWRSKRSAKALRITHSDFKKMLQGEIDQWDWADGLKFLSMIPCEIHLMILPFFLGGRHTSALLPIHLVNPKKKKEKPENDIAG